jgi:hypothetical protein
LIRSNQPINQSTYLLEVLEMKKRELATILAAHADGLIKGKDTAVQMLTDYPDAAAELEPLFRLAASVQAALVPVKAPVAFVGRLHKDLMNYSTAELPAKAPRSGQKVLWMGVAAAGSVLSVAGLALLVLRRLKTGKQTATAV